MGTLRTAVIGGGPAGCAAAHALSAAGRQVVLFEQHAKLGGRTSTWEDGPWRVDSGAGFFTNFYPTLSRLLSTLGMQPEVVELSRKNLLVRGGQRAELNLGSVSSFARFPFVGFKGKARMALQTARLALTGRNLDLSEPSTLAAYDDLCVRDDAVFRVGEEAYQVLVRSGIEPFWYFSCDEVSRSLAMALQARAATARFFTLRRGMDSVCQALCRGVDTRLAEKVHSLARSGPGVAVTSVKGSEYFDEVVLATTATAARELGAAWLSASTEEFLGSQRYVPNVHAGFRVPRSSCPPGVSAMLATGPGDWPLAALSFNSHKGQWEGTAPGGDELVSVFLTAKTSLELLACSEAETYERAWALARGFCPELPAQATPWRLIRRREAIPIHSVGRYRQAARVWESQRGPVVLAGDYLATATVDGALRTGEKAAEALQHRPP